MIYDFRYQKYFETVKDGVKTGCRDAPLNYLAEKKFSRVIDLGSSAGSWAADYLTHYVDLHEINHFNRCTNQNLTGFIGNLCSFSTWEKLLLDVEKNGKFDFAICTHTLEDLANPALVCEMLPRIAKEGFIAVPSKFHELKKHESVWLGWIHHRWIFNKENDQFVAYPKVSFMEHFNWSFVFNNPQIHDTMDLSFMWKDDFKLIVANNDFIGPGVQNGIDMFRGLANN